MLSWARVMFMGPFISSSTKRRFYCTKIYFWWVDYWDFKIFAEIRRYQSIRFHLYFKPREIAADFKPPVLCLTSFWTFSSRLRLITKGDKQGIVPGWIPISWKREKKKAHPLPSCKRQKMKKKLVRSNVRDFPINVQHSSYNTVNQLRYFSGSSEGEKRRAPPA